MGITVKSTCTTRTKTRYSSGCNAPGYDKKGTTRASRAGKQSFTEIRDQCLSEGRLFEDPEFPAINTSVYYSSQLPCNFEWKRPTELVAEPRVFVGGASRFDVKQGELGNCWFLASVASLCAASNKSAGNELLHRVVPTDNSFVDKYAGIVHIKLWQYGKWVDIVMDDRLPCVNGHLMFMHSADPNEFWSALLEKAYAKLNGSYEALSGGCSSEAMEDLTGGVVETYDFRKAIPPKLFTIMRQAHKRSSLMATQIDAPPHMIEAVQDNGLIVGHAYSITGVQELTVQGQTVNLVRIRNPWGNQYEWKGAWGDSSPELKMLSQSQRQEMGLSLADDGEFWMEYNDFTRNFQKMEICNLSPDCLEGPENKHHWETVFHEGTWKPRVNAGGCRNFLDTFWTNPQFRTEIMDADEGDDENLGTVIVGLMQKERRKKKSLGLDYLTIGLCIYKLKDPASCTGPLDLNFFKYNASVAKSPFSNTRESCMRFRLPPGHYVILPSTFNPNEEGDFIVRIYSERPTNTTEIDEETGMQDDDEDDASEIEARKRRMRAKEVNQDDVNQEQEARAIFKAKSGEDLEVDAFELLDILNSTYKKDFRKGFTLETCRSIVAMMDGDKSGKLGFDEFKSAWAELRKWKKIFLEFDADKSWSLCSYEMRQALNSAGMRVSNGTFNGIVMRYADREGKIIFDDFVRCAVRMKTMFLTYKDMCGDDGRPPAKFEMDEFIQTTMYA